LISFSFLMVGAGFVGTDGELVIETGVIREES
jgi:hypothetical protein